MWVIDLLAWLAIDIVYEKVNLHCSKIIELHIRHDARSLRGLMDKASASYIAGTVKLVC